MTGVELFNSIPGVGEIGQWFPAVITGIVAFPGNQVNSLTVPAFPHNLTVEDVLDFIFQAILKLDWFWGWGQDAIHLISFPGGEFVSHK